MCSISFMLFALNETNFISSGSDESHENQTIGWSGRRSYPFGDCFIFEHRGRQSPRMVQSPTVKCCLSSSAAAPIANILLLANMPCKLILRIIMNVHIYMWIGCDSCYDICIWMFDGCMCCVAEYNLEYMNRFLLFQVVQRENHFLRKQLQPRLLMDLRSLK